MEIMQADKNTLLGETEKEMKSNKVLEIKEIANLAVVV